MESLCAGCGVAFSVRDGSRGRPRTKCFECSPPRLGRKLPQRVPASSGASKCEGCGVGFSGHPVQRYCTRSCRDAFYTEKLKRENPCPGCGGPMSRRSGKSRPDAMCRDCRGQGRGAKGSRVAHGNPSKYRAGCRCDLCRVANSAMLRKYRERRAAEGRPLHKTSGPVRACPICEEDFQGRATKKFCSMRCATIAQGGDPDNPKPRDGRPRKWMSDEARQALFESVDWCCALCGGRMRPEVGYLHDEYPTLDHIVPRVRGGSDDPSNLQPAHRLCNLQKGARVDVPVRRLALVA